MATFMVARLKIYIDVGKFQIYYQKQNEGRHNKCSVTHVRK
jgi:hypothetical protein